MRRKSYGAEDAEGFRAEKVQSPEPLRPVVRGVELSDEALLAGLAAGDADTAAAFVRRFQRRVYGLALTILPSPAAKAMTFLGRLSAYIGTSRVDLSPS